jgi:hypothetical protein
VSSWHQPDLKRKPEGASATPRSHAVLTDGGRAKFAG